MPRMFLIFIALSTLTWFCDEVNMSVRYFCFQPSTSVASASGPRIMKGGAPSMLMVSQCSAEPAGQQSDHGHERGVGRRRLDATGKAAPVRGGDGRSGEQIELRRGS